jgi:hypothetical protein
MRIPSLGSLARVLFFPAFLLILAACGTNSQSNKICGGCAFLYATTNSNQILTLPINSGGALGTAGSSPGPANGPYIVGTGFQPQPPYGGPLYVSDPNTNAIDAFAVNGSNGTFAPMMGSPFSLGGPAGTAVGLLTFGNYLYAGDTNGTIAAFNIQPSGALTVIPGSPYAAGTAPLHLATAYTGSPSISLLYAADFTGGGIWAFTIGSDGALTAVPGSPFATPANSAPAGMFGGVGVVSGSILYVALSGLNEIAAFSITGSGALTPLPGSPFAAGKGPVTLFGSGNFVYAMNSIDQTISAYSTDQNTGILAEIQGSPFPSGTASGSFVNNPHVPEIFYVPDLQSNSILGFVEDYTTGSLAPLPGSPFLTGVGPVALTAVAFPVMDAR